MQIAQIENGIVKAVGDYRVLYPQTSFGANGPSDDWLTENGCMKVNLFKPHDRTTQKLATCDPYIEGGWVYTVEVVELTVEEAAAIVSSKRTKLMNECILACQARLDAFARTRNYDGILSATTYATSSVAKFKTEGQYAVEARDATWASLYTMLAEVDAGTRPMPESFADIKDELPTLKWPN